jgi:membrane-bound serine protease (ClpP class)
MSLFLIILIILTGLLFLFAEFFLLPGTTFMGIIGGLIIVLGVYWGYSNLGARAGNIIFICSLAGVLMTLFIGYRRLISKKWSVNSAIRSRMNEVDFEHIHVGDVGTTVSVLRMGGKALINDQLIEVFSAGDLIPSNTEIRVFKIEGSEVYVKPVAD